MENISQVTKEDPVEQQAKLRDEIYAVRDCIKNIGKTKPPYNVSDGTSEYYTQYVKKYRDLIDEFNNRFSGEGLESWIEENYEADNFKTEEIKSLYETPETAIKNILESKVTELEERYKKIGEERLQSL